MDNHPAYGVIEISRISSVGTTLVGSEIEHTQFFSLRIKDAEREESFGNSNFYGRNILCEVLLSANQFLNMLTQIDRASGVTCTLFSVCGERRPQPEKELSRIEKASSYGEERTKENIKRNSAIVEEIMGELDSLSAKKKEAIRRLLNDMAALNTRDAKFYLERITEATEESIQIAKTEVENYTSAVVRQLGIDSIKKIMIAENK